MFVVIVCHKYNPMTTRLVEVDSMEALARILQTDMGECQLCGPCSHVEIGPKASYWETLFHSESKKEALAELIDIVETCPDKYRADLDSARAELALIIARENEAKLKEKRVGGKRI